MPALLNVAVIVAAFAALAWSADRFVCASAGLARRLGMSPLLVGLVIIGFGTSAPEILVSALAAVAGNTGLAVGNALGSNIANVGLVLTLTAIMFPLTVGRSASLRELRALLAATLLVPLLLLDGVAGRVDGALLLLGLVIALIWLIRTGDPDSAQTATGLPTSRSLPHTLAWITGSLALLLVSARVLVWAAVELATAAGVSDLVIGLSVVAAGTSLPELATALAAARLRQHALVLGNILGSNLFNLLGVLGIAAFLQPAVLTPEVLYRDYLLMALMTLGLAVLVTRMGGMGRGMAVGILALYSGYLVLLFSI